ncbi:unnamed protein product [Didymodactylos carnosus]|uniref:Uncharacterized protein n=1 Tax=Didymodactylos carnosus TaxID=1234261 RepID=A0A8S2JGB6_9BILA|nr:unnamed protein product [Didymodactylos carnosus]CAF3808091.1 unnamed protein product [Didymodactylos carnosus]
MNRKHSRQVVSTLLTTASEAVVWKASTYDKRKTNVIVITSDEDLVQNIVSMVQTYEREGEDSTILKNTREEVQQLRCRVFSAKRQKTDLTCVICEARALNYNFNEPIIIQGQSPIPSTISVESMPPLPLSSLSPNMHTSLLTPDDCTRLYDIQQTYNSIVQSTETVPQQQVVDKKSACLYKMDVFYSIAMKLI